MNFTIDQWNHGYKIMIQKCIQFLIKENFLLFKDLLETWRKKDINVWLQYQKLTDRLTVVVNKYNNTYHSTVKIKPVDIKSRTNWIW